ncbi:MAG: molybdopterin cofactor-binding domain-containing protein [Acidimicrobiales bacterium]
MRLAVNGESHDLRVDTQVPLLNVLRNDVGLFGAKRGCAEEQCYACCVLLDGRAAPSCQLPVGAVEGVEVTTAEALVELREFFLAEQVGQCGFCISGMLVATESLLRQTRYPSDAQIREALDTNLCRCGVYDRVRRAIRFRIGSPEDPIWELRSQPALDLADDPSPSPSVRDNPSLDAWIRVDEADSVTINTGKAELGQGIRTALTHIAATQLGLDRTRINLTTTDTDLSPNEGVTSGSLSIETSGEAVSAATATARQAMVDRAAQQLGASPESLVVEDGTITDPRSGASTTYWDLNGGLAFDIDVDVASKRLPGDPQSDSANSRVDLVPKISAEPSFVHDRIDDETVFGRVLRPPQAESRLVSLDSSSAGQMQGVLAVVCDGSFVGVVAEREEEADAALEVLRQSATWKGVASIPSKVDDLLSEPTADYDVVDGVPVADPVAPPVHEFAFSATYSKPFTMHGSLGPSAAVGLYQNDELTVRSSTQGAFALRESLAEVVGLPIERIRIRHTEGAGCYGHNGADDVSLDAALLAMAVRGRPVLTSWSRADEHRWEPYGPAMIVRLSGDVEDETIAALGLESWSYSHSTRPRRRDDGSTNLLAGWHLEAPMERPRPEPMPGRHVGAHRNADPLYSIENTHVRVHLAQSTAIRTSALRGLGAFANIFAIESFIDEMAHGHGVDPIHFRLANLDDPRATAVIETVAAEALKDSTAPDHGQGLAFARYKNAQTYLAALVELRVDRATGAIDILRATLSADAGRIISADGVSNQLEGGCVQAASWTLKEEVRLDPNGIISEDWETYPILRFSESFPVRTILLDRPDQRPLGCGEAAQGPMAAAIANAVFDAVGVRLRDLPLTPERVLAALDTPPS